MLVFLYQEWTSTELCSLILNSTAAANRFGDSGVADFTGSTCVFESDRHLLQIYLSQNSQVLPNDGFVLTPNNVLLSAGDNFTHEWKWLQTGYDLTVDISRNPSEPVAKISGVSQIGSCMTVRLSSLASTQLGYTQPTYDWQCTSHTVLTDSTFASEFSTSGALLQIPWVIFANHFTLDEFYTFNLTITNILGAKDSIIKKVFVSSDAVPNVCWSKCPSQVTKQQLLEFPLTLKVAREFDPSKAYECLDDSSDSISALSDWSILIDINETNPANNTLFIAQDSNSGRVSLSHSAHPFEYGKYTFTAVATLYSDATTPVSTAKDTCTVYRASSQQ